MRILLLFCFLSIASLYAQKYNFTNYTVENGLAQSQINDINQDQQGYLWIATESGLSKFDGLNFVNFSMDDGLPDNKVEKIFIQDDQTLWVGTPKGIAKLEDDKFVTYWFESPQRVNDIQTFRDEIFIATNNGLLKFEGETFTEVLFNYGESLYIRSLENYQDSLLLCGGKTGIYTWNSTYSSLKDTSLMNLNVSDLSILGEKLIISTYGDGLLSYNLHANSKTAYDISSTRIRSMYVDEDVILCATINGAVEITEDKTTYYTEDNGLINQSLVCMFKDRENNYWFGTDSDGLLKFLGKSIISYSTDDGLSSNKVMSINQEPTGEMIFGTYRAGISKRINDTLYHYLNEQNGLKNNNIWATYVDKDGKCWIATTGGVECYSHDKLIGENVCSSIEGKIRSITYADGLYFFGGINGVYYNNNSASIHLENTSEMNVNDMAAYGDNIYIGSRDGLYVINKSDDFQNIQQIPLDEKNIYSLTSDSEGNIWTGTINGLFIIRPDNTIIPFELDPNDFQSKTVLGLLESSNGDIWASTMNGVYQIQIPDKNQLKYKINHYGIAEGLINLESNLNALFEDNEGKIWVGTASGVARIDPQLNDELYDFKSPELHFTGIRLFKEDFDYTQFDVTYGTNGDIPSTITLPYNKNHLTFDFIGLNLKDAKSVLYEYRLLGANSSWSPLSGTNYATYSAVSPGTYDFEVRATNKSFEWSNIRSIHIIISPPFWRSWWFILLSIVVVVVIITLIFQNRIKVIKQGQENERLGYKNRLLFLEQQSLNASMNRHFIFNSLNSIQYFINSSDKLSANKYLSSFAKLIRKNLDSSTANNFIVSLQEEIDRIKLYMTLEKMRFQEKFDYEITIDSGLDTEGIEIPSMILQPFVENAIIHGVLPCEQKGMIRINIFEEFDEVIFEVIDDGFGIDNSLENKQTSVAGDHESKGMEITSRRIELLRKLTGDNLLIIGPFQLNSIENVCLGTKVIIKMGIAQED